MKVAVLAITKHGLAQAARILAAQPEARLFCPDKFASALAAFPSKLCQVYSGKTAAQVPALLAGFDALICVVSIGAVVRLIAPHLGDKASDPAVLVVDEAGQFVIPVLSGHQGGANQLAGQLAAALGATPVLTTASDVRQTLAVDLLGREWGWRIEASPAALVHASAAMVNEETVALVQEAGESDWWSAHANGRSGPLPANLRHFATLEDVPLAEVAAVLWISRRPLPAELTGALAGRCIVYRPGDAACA
ncbi:cobalamin biosynthesis central domain-containing protein [Azonexus sp.]|uniref:cobalamin biosynthesis central domain-containing protein n=1 Tax=Azonexus sp. TaxID=1872668 RepID=UPI0039E5B47D